MQTKVINLKDFKIEVSSKHKRKLADACNCSTQHVRMALEYRSNSIRSQAIRNKAKELLLNEINKIDTITLED